MTSELYVGPSYEIPEGYAIPWRVGCIDCHMCATLLVSTDEFPLDMTPLVRAIIDVILQRKFPSEHDCEKFC